MMMSDINKHGWSKKWLRRLLFLIMGTVVVFSPAALYAYNTWGIWLAVGVVVLYVVVTGLGNRYISRKNKEYTEEQEGNL